MKIIKLSLAATILVGAVSANAQKLEDAIKNVEISGTAIYRYNDYENSLTSNYYKVATNVKSQIADTVDFNSRFILGDGTAPIAFNTSDSSDENVDFSMTEINLAYKGIDNTTIKLGKSAIPTPFTVQRSSTGDEQIGTGITAVATFDNISLNGGYFNQTNFDKSGNIKTYYTNKSGADFAFIGAEASFGGFTIDATYANAKDIFDVYTLGAQLDNKFSNFSLSTYARYTEQDFESESFKNKLWKVGTKLKAGIYTAAIHYGETGKEGGTVGVDEGSTVGFDEHWRVTLTGTKDASTLYASIKAQVTPKLNLGLLYSDLQSDSSEDKNEIYAKASYKMFSNLDGYLMFGEYDKEGDEKSTIGRLNIQYSF